MRLAIIAGAVFLFSLSLFVFRLGIPSEYMYDEAAYVPSARGLLHHQAEGIRQHPPLAKLFMAAGIRLIGDRAEGWRFAGAVFGAVSAATIFLWSYVFVGSIELALTATILTVFNNFLYVMSRVAMLDVFYFTFVLLGTLLFTVAVASPGVSVSIRRLLVILAGVLYGAGTACKWNALVFLVCMALIATYLYVTRAYNIRAIGVITLALGCCLVPAVVYCLAFWPLFSALRIPFSVHQLVSDNLFIWEWHKATPGNPTLNVRWYQWFFRASPERALSYLMGNFVVMWTGVAAIGYCVWAVLRRGSRAFPELLVAGFYIANIAQWLVIPQKSTCYYYYYPSAMLLGVAIVLAIFNLKIYQIGKIRVTLLLIVFSMIFFLYCYQRMAHLEAPFDCALGCWS